MITDKQLNFLGHCLAPNDNNKFYLPINLPITFVTLSSCIFFAKCETFIQQMKFWLKSFLSSLCFNMIIMLFMPTVKLFYGILHHNDLQIFSRIINIQKKVLTTVKLNCVSMGNYVDITLIYLT